MKAGVAINQKITVLCVDDEPQILSSLKRCLSGDDINVVVADCGLVALDILKQQSVDIIITDMRMPIMTGVELLKQVYTLYPHIHRFLLTGYADMSSLAAAVNLGKIDHFIEKPWDNKALISRVAASAESIRAAKMSTVQTNNIAEQNKKLKVAKAKLEQRNDLYARKIREVVHGQEQINASMYQLLQDMVGIHPHLSSDFSTDVSKTASNFAKFCQLSLEEINEIEVAGQLCEIGLLGATNEIKSEPFSTLSYRSQQAYYEQVQNVENLLSPIESLIAVEQILINQFEHADGTGYPNKKDLPEIPLGSRILAIARDFWRYKLGRIKEGMMADKDIFIEMKKFRGIRYDSVLLDAFIKNTAIISRSHSQATTRVNDLLPDQVLGNDIYDEQQRLLLSKDHVLTANCINSLKRIEKTRNIQLEIIIGALEDE